MKYLNLIALVQTVLKAELEGNDVPTALKFQIARERDEALKSGVLCISVDFKGLQANYDLLTGQLSDGRNILSIQGGA